MDPVPQGGGKVINTQLLIAQDYAEWTEGSALGATDPNPAYHRTITSKALRTVREILLSYQTKLRFLSDLCVNTSAVNFVEQIGNTILWRLRSQGYFPVCLNGLSAAGGGG